MDNSFYDIVIIGAGASAIAVLNQICLQYNGQGIKIALIDKPEHFGTGKVYQKDFSWLIMNTPADSLSINFNRPFDLCDWYYKKYNRKLSPTSFIDRSSYGTYLKETLHRLVKEGNEHTKIDLINGLVEDVLYEGKSIEIKVQDKGSLLSEKIVFATGPTIKKSIFSNILKNQSGYIHDPFPANKNLTNIPPEENIVILGSSLTAVDTAITLKNLGHRGQISMLSRNGLLPQVKNNIEIKEPDLPFLSFLQNRPVTLKEMLLYLRSQLQKHGFDWRTFLRMVTTPETPETFKKKIEQAQQLNSWFNVTYGLHMEAEHIWPKLDEKDLEKFVATFYKPWLYNNTAIPKQNADIILEMLESRQLSVHGGLSNIKKEGETFIPYSKDGNKFYSKFVINATGIDKSICHTNPLPVFQNLCSQKLLKERPSGGGIISPENSALLDSNSKEQNVFYAIGHPTVGSFPFVNNIESISIFAEKLVKDMLFHDGNKRRLDITHA